MTVSLPSGVKKLFEDANFAHVGTIMPDGSPHVSAVWVDVEGDLIVFNTAEGRVKPRNMRHDPRVSISVVDHQNPYSSAVVNGRVVEITAEGADDHIDRMAKKYLGRDKYPLRREGEQRLIVRIQPEHFSKM